MRYTKKPVTINAWQSFNNAGEVTTAWPRWIMDALRDGVVYEEDGQTKIKTLEGDHIVSDGDWIIQGVKGELYPCKPDIFEMTYDPTPSVQQEGEISR